MYKAVTKISVSSFLPCKMYICHHVVRLVFFPIRNDNQAQIVVRIGIIACMFNVASATRLFRDGLGIIDRYMYV